MWDIIKVRAKVAFFFPATLSGSLIWFPLKTLDFNLNCLLSISSHIHRPFLYNYLILFLVCLFPLGCTTTHNANVYHQFFLIHFYGWNLSLLSEMHLVRMNIWIHCFPVPLQVWTYTFNHNASKVLGGGSQPFLQQLLVFAWNNWIFTDMECRRAKGTLHCSSLMSHLSHLQVLPFVIYLM